MANPALVSRVNRLLLTATAVALLAGCGGGGGGGGSTAIPATSSGGSASQTLSFTISNPVSVTGDSRKPQTVASSINGLAVFAFAASGTMPTTPTFVGDLSLTPSAGNTSLCVASGGSRVCTITFSAPVGADIVFIKLYDMEPSGGAIPSTATVLASGSGTLTVNLNGTNSATITLNSTAPFAVGTTAMLTPTAVAPIASGSVSFALPAGTSGSVSANVSEVLQLLLPLGTARKPQFVSGAGNTEIWAFGLNLTPSTTTLPSPGMTLNGTAFVLTGSLLSTFTSAPSGTLNIALYTGTGYTDVGYVTYAFTTATKTLAITSDTQLLGGESGINQTGVYVVYLPPAGSAVVPTVAANSISVSFAPPTGTISGVTYNGTSYYPVTGSADPSLNYLVLGNAAPVTVTVTAYDSSGNAINGSLTTPIVITNSNPTVFTMSATTLSSSPGTFTLLYTGGPTETNGATTSTTIGTSTSGITVNKTPSATISAACLKSNSPYENANDDQAGSVDIGEDAKGCG